MNKTSAIIILTACYFAHLLNTQRRWSGMGIEHPVTRSFLGPFPILHFPVHINVSRVICFSKVFTGKAFITYQAKWSYMVVSFDTVDTIPHFAWVFLLSFHHRYFQFTSFVSQQSCMDPSLAYFAVICEYAVPEYLLFFLGTVFRTFDNIPLASLAIEFALGQSVFAADPTNRQCHFESDWP